MNNEDGLEMFQDFALCFGLIASFYPPVGLIACPGKDI